MSTIAVILSGCGVFDGSEIHESVFVLQALDALGYQYQCLAPDDDMAIINHMTQQEEEGQRNSLIESARIARGDCKPLGQANPEDYVAAIFPGGFGVAKHLSTFAAEGADCSIHQEVLKFAQAMAQSQKPQGFLCIAPVLMPKIYGKGVRLTIGNDSSTIEAIEAMGGHHQEAKVDEVVIDEGYRAVSSPAYMLATSITQAHHSVTALVHKLDELIREEK